MSPVRPNEAELEGVLHAIRLVFAAQACEAHSVVDALSAVFMADIENDRLFAEVEEQPRSVSH